MHQQTVLRAATLATIATAAVAASSPDWNLSTNELNRTAWQRQPYVANGYISQRIPAGAFLSSSPFSLAVLTIFALSVEGFGYREVVPTKIDGDTSEGTNGWPLFDPRFTAAMIAGFYDSQPETIGTNFVSLFDVERCKPS